jgi:hypothetical protein
MRTSVAGGPESQPPWGIAGHAVHQGAKRSKNEERLRRGGGRGYDGGVRYPRRAGGCAVRGRGCRQRPTLPQCKHCSTIGAGELNDRVRDGIGWGLSARTTGIRVALCEERRRRGESEAVESGSGVSVGGGVKPNGRLVPLGCTRYRASTCGLSTSWSPTDLQGVLILSGVSHLDAFSGYPYRT